MNGLLTVWNPLLQPETVVAHIDRLKDRPHTWWVRARRPAGAASTIDSARVRWIQAEEEMAAARAAGRPLMLFVTDFSHLHVLACDDVRFLANADQEVLDASPPYYADLPGLGLELPLWFRVRDVQALSFDRQTTLRTLHALQATSTGKSPWGYDPFAARMTFDYPIRVALPEKGQHPALDELFSPELLARLAQEERRPALRFADLAQTRFPPAILKAHRIFEQRLGRGWSGLEEFSKVSLATAEVIRQRTRDLDGVPGAQFDHAAVCTGLARAVEREVVTELLLPLSKLRAAIPEVGRLLADLNPQITLGSTPLFGRLERWATAEGLPGVALLCGRESLEWFKRFVRLRNGSSHVSHVDAGALHGVWEELVGEHPTPRLSQWIDAKHEVAVLSRHFRTRGNTSPG